MLSLNVILSLIMQSKRKGSGVLSNGSIYVSLMLCISDITNEKELLNCFNNEVIHREAYRKLGRYLSRFLKDGNGYPYSLFSLTGIESSIGNIEKMSDYLRKLEVVLSSFIDPHKVDELVYTLLELLRNDDKIDQFLYGADLIQKRELFGTCAHPKRICAEALILGLLYQTHKSPKKAERIELIECPEKLTFHMVRFSAGDSLDLQYKIEVIDNIRLSAKRQKTSSLHYPLDCYCEGMEITEQPKKGNVFLYGARGVGKTAFLKSVINTDDSTYLYLPLGDYREEKLAEIPNNSCWIMLNILLKFHYQSSIATFDILAANEGKETVLQQLSRLNECFSIESVYGPKWSLILDGMDDIPLDQQGPFLQEIEYICCNWKNVRLIVSGRTVPANDIFGQFMKCKVYGISEEVLKQCTSDDRLHEVLKIPAVLQMYEKNSTDTEGELLDAYFMGWKGNDATRFILRFVLPFIAKTMLEDWSFHDITRAEIMRCIDNAIEIYVLDDHVYENFVLPNEINKKSLLESRLSDDWIELLVKNIGLMEESGGNKLHFTEPVFRDYFAAKHILNAISIFDVGRRNAEDPIEYFDKLRLSGIWFDNMDTFPEKANVYRLIGELCGDYINGVDSEDYYTETLLDSFLGICRRLEGGYNVENIIIVKRRIHHDLICGVNFSYLNMPLILPTNVRYSYNGEHPCDFYGSRVYRVGSGESSCENSFKNCDFTGVRFLDTETKENLRLLGAIVDNDDENIMEEEYKELISPWIF